MRQLRGNRRTGQRVAGALDRNLTVQEARAIRAEEARLAVHCANRAEQARAVAQYGAMRHWTQEYCRATTQCRVLGELIRRGSGGTQATRARHDPTVAALSPRPAAGLRSAGGSEPSSGAPRDRAKRAHPPPLHELEQAVMEEVWRREQASVREVMEALNARGDADRAYTTYMTIMSRLDGKGLLSRRREGKTDFYRAVYTRDRYADLRA